MINQKCSTRVTEDGPMSILFGFADAAQTTALGAAISILEGSVEDSGAPHSRYLPSKSAVDTMPFSFHVGKWRGSAACFDIFSHDLMKSSVISVPASEEGCYIYRGESDLRVCSNERNRWLAFKETSLTRSRSPHLPIAYRALQL